MSIAPSSWGPGYWRTIHSIAFWYPTNPSHEQQSDAIRFFTALGGLLPCTACRTHYAENLRAMPIENAVGDRMTLLKWTIDLHNAVNASTGARVLRVDDAILSIERSQSSPPTAAPNALAHAALFVTLGVAIGVLVSARGWKDRAK